MIKPKTKGCFSVINVAVFTTFKFSVVNAVFFVFLFFLFCFFILFIYAFIYLLLLLFVFHYNSSR